MSQHYTLDIVQRAAQEQFAKQSQRYGAGHILADVSDVVAALEGVPLLAPSRVLDVATGAGHTGLYLASLGHEVTCADLTEPMLERVREAAAERGLRVEVRQHAAEKMPYLDASFHLVTCRIAPHHFSSAEAFVAETARVLRPGGWFLLIDSSLPDGEPEAEAWIHEIEMLRDPSHHRLLTPSAWTTLCEQHGLEVKSVGMVPLKQPDLDWYFETAATPARNRARVRGLVAEAPEAARRVFRLGEEEGKVVWWWPRLTLTALRA
ncbi:MAG: class I SAM-dependent methyltransferase [Verrucomicrobiota bacterium]|nr:class I SAM-dependent methyltransferase [Verrucomicrobiota bacterium]